MKDQKAAQLKTLVASGLSVQEASESLGLEVDAAMDYLSGAFDAKEQTVEDFIASKKLRMAEVLFEIANDPTCENIAARVSAAKVFVEGKGETPDIPVDKLSEYYKKMRDVVTRQKNETATNPSPSTTVVNVEGDKVANKVLVTNNS